ncbi:restriction endonuclease subunit S [Thalassolituus oleivorans]|uniref:restriction endonuclease subunit S n=1 Tax=Thalassolituus oleivorans TaxID=187493 RepID=UPI0004BC2018|nr:restriction endonuclease subunit S [Thalassolituus oleivorans]
MSAEWPLKTLSDFIKIKHGFAFKGEYFKNEATDDLLVTPGNFAIGGGFKADKFKYYDGPVAQDYILQKGDLVVTMTDLSKQADTLGYSAIIPYFLGKRLLHNQRVGLVDFKNNEIDKTYLYFLLRSKEYRNHVLGGVTGTTVKHTSPTKILSYQFRKPAIEKQVEIGRQLIVLEKKIQLNRQINQTLESMAQAIFQSWFVDFDPVKAKIAAREQWQILTDDERTEWLNELLDKQAFLKTCLSELTANGEQNASETLYLNITAMTAISSRNETSLADMPADEFSQLYKTASLFPERLVESELGEIPEGWEASTLGKNFDVVMGQSPKGDTYNEDGDGMVFFQGRRDFGFRYPTPRVYTTDPKRIAQAGDTLISVRAPVGDRNMARQTCCLGRGVASIKHKSGARSFTFSFIGHIEKNLSESGSSGTVFSSINKNELNAVKFVAPNSKMLEVFESNVEALDKQVEVNSEEIDTLEIMRDSLLPKLLSGELDVSALTELSDIEPAAMDV